MNRARIAATFLAGPAAAFAHHSGLYDEQNIVAIEGAIAELHWINPHVRFTVVATAADGGTTSWDVEATSINALERWGVERDWFAVGDRVVVNGPLSRFEPHALAGATVQFADGRTVVLWPNLASRLKLADTGGVGLLPRATPDAPAAAEPARGLFSVWTPRGRLTALASLPLTQRAREAARAYEPLKDDPALRCIAAGMPVMLDTPYPIEFVDQGDIIVMRLEEWDGLRTIYMKPGGAPPVQEQSPNGISFGRWEGKTLAIFTTYIDYPYADDLGTPQSGRVSVLERYTPSDDGTRLESEVTVTDPATFTEPIVRRGWMAFEPGQTIKRYDCTLVARPEVEATK